MTAYIMKRLLRMIPVMLAVVTIVFFMMHLIPGDPAQMVLGQEATDQDIQELRSRLGLDLPLHIQYLRFLGGLVRGDLGTSYITGRPVLRDALERFWRTLQLASASLAIAGTLGVVMGIVAGIKPYSFSSGLIMFLALLGVSVPAFWLGILLMLVFSLQLHWLPSAGTGTWQHLVLPSITLATWSLGVIARMTRASMLEVLRTDYIRTARAKGVTDRVVVTKHALRNALIPITTIIGLRFGYMLGGAVATETVFSWPGLGRFLVEAILSRDFPGVQAGILLFAIGLIIVNLVVDVTYVLADPRITYN